MTQTLRIVHTESSCGWGGQEIRILTEAAGMMERGHQLHILCVEGSNIHHEAMKRGIPVTGLPIGRKNFSGLHAIRRWLRDNPVDVVNTHSSTDSWLVALARLGLQKRIPVVRTRHISALIPQNWATRWLYTKGCDFVVTTGERLREYVIERTQIAAGKTLSVPTGIDAQRFMSGDRDTARRTLGLPTDRSMIGIVATIRTWKGHVYLVEALAKLKQTNVELLIVGDGPNQANVQRVVDECQLNDRVRFVGQQENVVPWLQAMDIFVLPSYANEGVPQSLIQAMMCGVPVISTNVGSITELVADQSTGIIVPAKNADDLAAAIQVLLANSQRREQLAKMGQSTVLSNFSLDIMIRKMETVFVATRCS